ncbi:hypothetical protein HMPREF3293_02084 [Christensenella minuta]|uniref:Uncharacterized protein n=1 Tax=Christensenella minuta TaxID=626937 RepID=A0A136Q2C3_9FIRM|nr:hypothetical protein HMPREF3293_02084 [Christensenella minuta]
MRLLSSRCSPPVVSFSITQGRGHETKYCPAEGGAGGLKFL